MSTSDHAHFLRVPPFPGARRDSLVAANGPTPEIDERHLDRLMDRVAALKVGGDYWGPEPSLPDSGYALVRIRDPDVRAGFLKNNRSCFAAEALADPWHLVSGAAQAIVDADDELALVAALAGVPVRCIGDGPFRILEGGGHGALRETFRRYALKPCIDPFTGADMDFEQAVDLSAFWRRLIDSNRDITAAVGFALWKRQTVAPLLWGGDATVPFAGKRDDAKRGDHIAVWKSRIGARSLAQLERSGADLIEVEDGFIRSVGLGADCVPPLAIVIDRGGIYFDPGRASELEQLLEKGEFPSELLDRARQLRDLIVDLGISKYGVGQSPLEKREPGKRHLLVVGQVEDDRAVVAGGGPSTNLELLKRVREANAGAHLIYKPHPDVEAGHRAGAVPREICLAIADEIAPDAPISSVIEMVDEVHVNTSLAGYEALLRGKPVTAYGVPFYAGWGLTRDLGPVPDRRTRRRSLDELVAAALLLYPRYLDPVTRLPCPPEILVRRLADRSANANAAPLVRFRQLQGRLKRKFAAFQRVSQ
jgi:capsular polysaccharide export protein